MTVPLTVEYVLTPDVTARATAAYLRTRARFTRPALVGFGLSAAGLVLITLRLVQTDDWVVRVAAGVALLVVVLSLLLCGLILLSQFSLWRLVRRTRREADEGYSAAPAPTVRWVFTADGFTTTLGELVRTTPWSAVRSLSTTPEFWIVGVRAGPDLMLPRAAAPAGLEALLRAAVPPRATASAG